MLNKKEKNVLKAILDLSGGKSTVLLPPVEILKRIPYNISIAKKELKEIIKTLEYDGYLELIESEDSKGQRLYCITLTAKGQGFDRELLHYRRMVYFKIILTVATAILGFLVTRLLTLL